MSDRPTARLALLLAITMTLTLAAPASFAGPLVPLPCTEVPVLCTLGVIILGDTVVEDGETESHDEKTVVAAGSIEVRSGGTFELLNSSLTFMGESNGIRVESGGTLIIINSSVQDPGTDGDRHLIRADAGASVTITVSVIDGFSVRIAANATTMHSTDFQRSDVALFLDNVNFTVNDSRFFQNTVSINITGGSPTITDNDFVDGETHIEVWQSNPIIMNSTMTGALFSIIAKHSGGTYQANSMADAARPPSHGFEFRDCDGTPSVTDNSLVDWGIGILVDDCSGLLFGDLIASNFFSGNGQNVVMI